jgi:hypothetical protein
MVASSVSLLAVAAIALAAYGIGRPLLRGLKVAENDPLAIGVLSIAGGLIAAATALAALGVAGCLYGQAIGILTLAAAFWGIGELGNCCAGFRLFDSGSTNQKIQNPKSKIQNQNGPPAFVRRSLTCLAAAALGTTLLSALAPPTAGDALCYHLELPKQFLHAHALVYLPDSDNSTYPLLIEMLYLWSLVLDGPVAAQLVHCGLGILLALAAVLLATPLVGRPWSWCAGCLTLLVPAVTNQMAAPLNDLGLAAFTTLALAAWWRGFFEEEHSHWYLLAGWFLGGALGTKHLALAFALAVTAVFTAWVCRHGGARRALLGAATTFLVAASVSGLWYLRATWHCGNPVYPFFQDTITGAGRATLPADKAPLGRGPVNLARAPWLITMHPERFGGRGHQLGVVFLAALPGLFIARRLRGLNLLWQIGLGYFVCWYLLRQNLRFLLPLVPLASTAVVWVWMESRRLPFWPRWLFTAAMAGVLSVNTAICFRRARDRAAVALGWESRDSYLSRCEPSYPIALWAQALDPSMRLLSTEQRTFYFPGQATRENIYRRRTAYDRGLASPGDLSQRLQGDGFTHLLLAEVVSGSGIHYNQTLNQLIDAAVRDGAGASLECLAQHDGQDADGVVRRYRLIALRRNSAVHRD